MKNLAPKIILTLTGLMAAELSANSSNVIGFAQTAAGSPYKWGGTTWDPQNRHYGGIDCSALVQKAWGYPRQLSPREPIPNRLTTRELSNPKAFGLPFVASSNIEQSNSGDAYVCYSSRCRHALLVKTNQNGVVRSVEARGLRAGVGNFDRTTASIRNSGYKLVQQNATTSVKTPETEEKTRSNRGLLARLFSFRRSNTTKTDPNSRESRTRRSRFGLSRFH